MSRVYVAKCEPEQSRQGVGVVSVDVRSLYNPVPSLAEELLFQLDHVVHSLLNKRSLCMSTDLQILIT